ncbi:MAG: hypothetical protein FWH21_03925 [Kiritimatiellaeota bacterium]|nr:hypothetical protein [Kiritimatiellota bacterium]
MKRYSFTFIAIALLSAMAANAQNLKTIGNDVFSLIPPPPPAVSVICSDILYTEKDGGGVITITLSEPFPYPVIVNLVLAPPQGANPGSISLSVATVTFSPEQTTSPVPFIIQDGTLASHLDGFTITPGIPAGQPGNPDTVYAMMNPGHVYVADTPPTILQPIQGSSLPLATVGKPYTFSWDVSDVMADQAGLTNLWQFGDGTVATTYGASGSFQKTFQITGTFVNTLVSMDKDGGMSTVYFYITVEQPNSYIVTFLPGNAPTPITFQPPPQTITNGVPTALNFNYFYWEGYRFKGWLCDADNKIYENCATVLNLTAAGGEVTMTAQWAWDWPGEGVSVETINVDANGNVTLTWASVGSAAVTVYASDNLSKPFAEWKAFQGGATGVTLTPTSLTTAGLDITKLFFIVRAAK